MTMIPRPTSYLVADRSTLTSWVGSWVSGIPMRHEHQMFFGVGAAVIALAGCALSWRLEKNGVLVRVSAITLLALVLMTTMFGSHSFYHLILKVPGLSSVRAVSRVVLVMMLPLAILVAAAFEFLHQKWLCAAKPRVFNRVALLSVAVILLTLETVMYKPYHSSIASWLERKAEVEKLLPAEIAHDAILYLTQKQGEHFAYSEIDAMIVAQDRLLPTVNGYSGNAPKGYTSPDPCISAKKRINDFFLQNPSSSLNRKDLERRLLTVMMAPCPHEPSISAGWVITGAAAENIQLTLNADQEAQAVRLILTISNLSNAPFSAVYGRGPVRLSWRFVPLDQSGRRLTEPPWEARRDLSFVLEPDANHTESFIIQPPAKTGRYVLEATLVQEGVSWFHDLGMQIPSIKFEVIG